QMKQLIATAMEHGALGLSTSLQYVPDRFASTKEIVELAKIASKYSGVYFTHQRSESGHIFESLDEVITISREAAIPAEIWHLKTAYKSNWEKCPRSCAGSNRRERPASMSQPISIRTHGRRTGWMRACHCGFAKAVSKRCWRG